MYVDHDDDDDDDDRILHIVRVMNILCFLSWSVDFSTYDDGNDVSTVYATDYSITNIYLSIYHYPAVRWFLYVVDMNELSVVYDNSAG